MKILACSRYTNLFILVVLSLPSSLPTLPAGQGPPNPPVGPPLFPCCFWGSLPAALGIRAIRAGFVPHPGGGQALERGHLPTPPHRGLGPCHPQHSEGTSFSRTQSSAQPGPLPPGARRGLPGRGLGVHLPGGGGRASREGAWPLQPSLHPVIYSEGFKSRQSPCWR